MPTQMLGSLGPASQANRLTVVMTRERQSQYPPRDDPETTISRAVHAADGPHVHPRGQRQPLRAHPRRRDRRPRRAAPLRGAGGEITAYSSGRLPGDLNADRVDHARRQSEHGLAAGPGHRRPERGDADLRPQGRPHVQPTQPAGDRRRPALGAHLHDDHLGHAGAHDHPPGHRRLDGAGGTATVPVSFAPITGSHFVVTFDTAARRVRRQLLLGGTRWRSRSGSPRSASPA